MARNRHFVTPLFLFLILGCATLSGLTESKVQTVENPPLPISEEPVKPVVFDSPTPVKHEESRALASSKEALSKEEIRQVQERLKAAGFDPGPIDGILGSRTRAVLLRVQAGCAIVNDLVGTSDTEIFASAPETQAPELTAFAKSLSREEVQQIQERLKAAGFDPGPIDGMWGAKTRSALSRCKSGCTALGDLLGSSDKRVFGQTTAIPAPPAGASAQAAHPVVSNSPPPKESVKNPAGKPTASVSNVSEQQIRLAQERLKAAGFDPGPIDGMVGPKTKAALEKYRSSRGLTPSSGIEAVLDY